MLIFYARLKKIEEKNKFDEDTQEELFCQKLKEALKNAIKVWNKFQGGEKSIQDLKVTKEITAEKLIEVILSPSENKDIQRIKKNSSNTKMNCSPFLIIQRLGSPIIGQKER